MFMLGNEAIARGAIEAGVQVVAAYPGTPSTEIAETLYNLAGEVGYYAEWSVNEKVAFGVAMGASWCNVRALAIMKHVGVNLAMDQLTSAGYVGAIGGLVLVAATAATSHALNWSSILLAMLNGFLVAAAAGKMNDKAIVEKLKKESQGAL